MINDPEQSLFICIFPKWVEDINMCVRPGDRFPVWTVYLPSYTSVARDRVPSLNDLAVDGT